jgi:hypothetical protein
MNATTSSVSDLFPLFYEKLKSQVWWTDNPLTAMLTLVEVSAATLKDEFHHRDECN